MRGGEQEIQFWLELDFRYLFGYFEINVIYLFVVCYKEMEGRAIWARSARIASRLGQSDMSGVEGDDRFTTQVGWGGSTAPKGRLQI